MTTRLGSALWLPYKEKALVYCFQENHNSGPRPTVYGSYNWGPLVHFVYRNPRGPFEFVHVQFDDRSFYLALSGWAFLHGEDQKRSGNSGARYIAKRDRGDRGFLLQIIDPYRETSGHAHADKIESFNPILGYSALTLGNPGFEDGEIEHRLGGSLFVPESAIVQANFWHRLVTHDRPALTILEIVGPNALGMEDYIRDTSDSGRG